MILYIIAVIFIIIITTIVYYKLSYKNGFLSSRAAFSIGISSIIISLAFPFVISHINLLILNLLKNLSFSEEVNIIFTLLFSFIIFLIMVCFLSIILSTIVIRKEIVFNFKGSDSINELMDGKNNFNYLNDSGYEHENFVDSKEIIDKMRLDDDNSDDENEKVEEVEEVEEETAEVAEKEEVEEIEATEEEEEAEEETEATEEEEEAEEETEATEEEGEAEEIEATEEEEEAEEIEATEEEDEVEEETEATEEEEEVEEEIEAIEEEEEVEEVEEETAEVAEKEEVEEIEATEEEEKAEEETVEVAENNAIIDAEEKEKLESEIAGLIDEIEEEDEPSREKEIDEIEKEDAGFVEKQTDIEYDNTQEFEEHVSKAFELKKDNNFEEAILYFTYALDNAPDEDSVFWIVLDICTIYKKMGQVDLAKDILGSYVKEYGDSMNEYLIEQIEYNLQ